MSHVIQKAVAAILLVPTAQHATQPETADVARVSEVRSATTARLVSTAYSSYLREGLDALVRIYLWLVYCMRRAGQNPIIALKGVANALQNYEHTLNERFD